MPYKPLCIGDTPQYFFDNHVIEMCNLVTRTMHQPKRHGNAPILKKDKPWEKVLYLRTNTWNCCWDEQEKLYKLWYEDLAWDYDTFAGRNSTTHGLEAPGFHETCDNRYLYAESTDGLTWTKPELDYRDVDGRKTNICLGNEKMGKAHAATFLQDPFETDPSRRFKVIFWNEKHGVDDALIHLGYSKDGRSWNVDESPMIFGDVRERLLGDVMILTADPVTGEYILDTRFRAMCEYPGASRHQPGVNGWGMPFYPNAPTRNTKRRIYTTYTRDLVNWAPLQELLSPDPLNDGLDDEFYGMTRFRMGDMWVAFLNIFHRTRNTITMHLIHSRDGKNWTHAGQRQPFLDLGPDHPDTWDRYLVETCNQPLFLDDEIRIYYAGSSFHHDWWQHGIREGLDHPEASGGPNSGECALGLATLRPDGFVSIDSHARDGIVITRPVISDGDQLILNVACGDKGCFSVALLDVEGQEIPGYGKDDCDLFTGDATSHVVRWSGKSELPRESFARGVKLCFFSRHAALYSFRLSRGDTSDS